MKALRISLIGLAVLMLISCTALDQGSNLSDEELVATAVARIQEEMNATQAALLSEQGESDPSVVESTSDSQPAAEEEMPPAIPGLDPIDVIYLADSYGFDCNSPELKEKHLIWSCFLELDDSQYQIKLWGRNLETVDMIEVAAFYYDLDVTDYSDLSSLLFGEIARIPFSGSIALEAENWVSDAILLLQSVGDERVSTFQGVRYYLYTLPSMHVMEVGSLQ